jgi:putative copper resistance protein D
MLTEAATNVLLYAAVLQTVGAAAAFWVVTRPATGGVGAGGRIRAEGSIRRVGLRASVAVVVALMLRGWAHTATVFGFAQSTSWGALSTIVVESRWGRSWQIQVLAAMACVVAYALVGRGRRSLQVATAIASAALALALTRTGHAAGAPGRMAIHTAHVLGAGMWLGTLTALVSVRRSVDRTLRRSIFRAFARVAFTGAAVLVAAGIVASWWYVGSFVNLWTTAYGRVLLIKVALVGGVVVCGYVNWRAIESGQSEPGRAAIVELMLAAAVVAATGVLTELEHP